MAREIAKIDLKDRKILYELDSNCRQPLSKIAKKVGLSTEAVFYRIKKLEKGEIIIRYLPVVDFSKLGIIKFKILLTLQHINSEKLGEIITALKKDKNVKWLATCEGNWDLMITLDAISLNEIDNQKDKILNLFKNKIAKKAVSIIMDARVYNRDYLIKNASCHKRTRVVSTNGKGIKLRDIDLKILKKICENARKPLVSIASELNKDVKTVNCRIKKLIKEEVITGFRVALNYSKLGIKFYKIFIYLDNCDQKEIRRIIQYFENNKNAVHYIKTFGSWDIESEFEVYSDEEFNEILKDIKDEFSKIISHIEVITIDKEHKFVYL